MLSMPLCYLYVGGMFSKTCKPTETFKYYYYRYCYCYCYCYCYRYSYYYYSHTAAINRVGLALTQIAHRSMQPCT